MVDEQGDSGLSGKPGAPVAVREQCGGGHQPEDEGLPDALGLRLAHPGQVGDGDGQQGGEGQNRQPLYTGRGAGEQSAQRRRRGRRRAKGRRYYKGSSCVAGAVAG